MAVAELLVNSGLGANLRRARRAANLTQQQAADAIGVTKQTISDQERGVAAPSEKNFLALCQLYGVEPGAMRYDSNGDSPAPRVALGLPQPIRVWIQEFLTKLVRADVSEREVDEARRVLTSPEMHRAYVGSEPQQYSEDETLLGIQAHAVAIETVLRSRGYEIPR